MPKVVITHNVVDVAKWLEFKAERADSITASPSSSDRNPSSPSVRNGSPLARQARKWRNSIS